MSDKVSDMIEAEKLYLKMRSLGFSRFQGEQEIDVVYGVKFSKAKLDRMDAEETWKRPRGT